MTHLLAVCIREPGNELIAAECENLAGGILDQNGIARCQTLQHVQNAAYIRWGVKLIAEAPTLDQLVQDITDQSVIAKDFSIDFMRLSDHISVDRSVAIIAVANVIKGFPNLESPLDRFLLAVEKKDLWFGEIVTEPDQSYQLHDLKPYRTSSSLPSRLSRALVNLITPPARTILDLGCGTGSILLEAQALGLVAYGSDKNLRMVGMSRKNLENFGYKADVQLADASSTDRTAEAIVTDLPYGRYLCKDDENIFRVLKNAAHLAPVAVYVAGNDITQFLREAGYHDIEVFRVAKRPNFIRYVHRARSLG
jgi:tRNA G10  N-methylase Trm11